MTGCTVRSPGCALFPGRHGFRAQLFPKRSSPDPFQSGDVRVNSVFPVNRDTQLRALDVAENFQRTVTARSNFCNSFTGGLSKTDDDARRRFAEQQSDIRKCAAEVQVGANCRSTK